MTIFRVFKQFFCLIFLCLLTTPAVANTAQNDADRLYRTGQNYHLGTGVKTDFERAEYFYLKAARLGHMLAQYDLGVLYHTVSLLPQADTEKAVYWWTQAARKGYAPAQYKLGILYYNDAHIPPDYIKAYAWMLQAYRQDYALARLLKMEIARFMTPKQIDTARTLSQTLLLDTSEHTQPPITDLFKDSDLHQPILILHANNKTSPLIAEKSSCITGNFYIQLIAMRSRNDAENLWSGYQVKYSDVLTDLEKRIIPFELGPKRGKVYRLQAGCFPSHEEANKRCEMIKKHNLDCFVIRNND